MGRVLKDSEVDVIKQQIVDSAQSAQEYDEWENDWLFGEFEQEVFPDLQFIEQEGGGEGGGEYCYSVIKWKDTYYKVTYSYYSYEGFDFDYGDWQVVVPSERLITVYE